MAYQAGIYQADITTESRAGKGKHELELTTGIMFLLREHSYLVFVLVLS